MLFLLPVNESNSQFAGSLVGFRLRAGHQPGIGALAEQVFGAKPVVVSLPYRESIGAQDEGGGFTVIIAGAPSKRLEAIRAVLDGGRPVTLAGERIGAARVDVARAGRLPTDDWPLLYLREPRSRGANRGRRSGVLVLAILHLRRVRAARRPD